MKKEFEKDLYIVLGVSPDATAEEIRAAYLSRARILHPDRFNPKEQPQDWKKANDMLAELNEAYSTLRNASERAQYDRFRAGTSQRQSSPEPTQSQPQPEPPSAPFESCELTRGCVSFKNLPENVKERLLKRQQNEIKDQFYIKTGSTIWNYIFIVILLCWYGYLYISIDGGRWEDETIYWYIGITFVVGALIGRNFITIRRFSKATLKSYLYITPIYFIFTDHDIVSFWPLWDLKDFKITHNHKNGSYQNSDIVFIFSNCSKSIQLSSKQLVEAMFERLKTYDSRLRAAIARKEQQYIFEHDDFYKVSRSEVPSIILLSKPKRVFIYLLSIFTCSIGLFVAIAANEGHNREPRQKYNTVSNGTAPIPRTMTKTEFEEKYGINPSPPGSTAPPQINFPQTDVSSAKTSVEKLTKEIQQYLTILGYKPGPIDGLLGDKTTNAIKSYQKDTGLIEDGKITWNLRDLLKAASQSPSTSVVSSVKQPDKGPWEKYSSGNTVNGQILPQSGDVRLFTNDECIAPFEIRAGQGSHYLVKLVRAYNDTSVLTVFVRSGTTVNIDVPLGNYEVRYAAGNTWYGYDSLFGPETSYNKANETFNFEIEGNQVSGFTITLYTVANGNLSMKKINPQDF